MRKYVDRASALRSVGKALDRGAAQALRVSRLAPHVPHSWKINYAGNCQNPRTVLRDGVHQLPAGMRGRVYSKGMRPVLTELEVPCRKCPNCLKRRAAHWRLRAHWEWANSDRTWFGSLTLSPEKHFLVLSLARRHASKNGDDFDMFDKETQFLARHKIISEEITRSVKRMRKNSGATLRLLCVTEAHKSGLPHYHMLVHEKGPVGIRKKTLHAAWPWGFSSWKLVTDPGSAGYVTKYLNKSALARVRASKLYGNQLDDDLVS